jgi:hypothetical protein
LAFASLISSALTTGGGGKVTSGVVSITTALCVTAGVESCDGSATIALASTGLEAGNVAPIARSSSNESLRPQHGQ